MTPPTPHHCRPSWWRHDRVTCGPFWLWEIHGGDNGEDAEVQIWHESAGIIDSFRFGESSRCECVALKVVFMLARAEAIGRQSVGDAIVSRLKSESWPPASVVEALNSGDGSYRP